MKNIKSFFFETYVLKEYSKLIRFRIMFNKKGYSKRSEYPF